MGQKWRMEFNNKDAAPQTKLEAIQRSCQIIIRIPLQKHSTSQIYSDRLKNLFTFCAGVETIERKLWSFGLCMVLLCYSQVQIQINQPHLSISVWHNWWTERLGLTYPWRCHMFPYSRDGQVDNSVCKPPQRLKQTFILLCSLKN